MTDNDKVAIAAKINAYISALVYNATKINVDQKRINQLINAQFDNITAKKQSQTEKKNAKIAAVLS